MGGGAKFNLEGLRVTIPHWPKGRGSGRVHFKKNRAVVFDFDEHDQGASRANIKHVFVGDVKWVVLVVQENFAVVVGKRKCSDADFRNENGEMCNHLEQAPCVVARRLAPQRPPWRDCRWMGRRVWIVVDANFP